ncbi:Glycosyl hydrolase family 43, five-bladed beta-propellor domain protein [Ascosphaera apis ARSEF 7405]|uniref:beta-fructofuranosidase n=1 Tax=Ascosphaera apis ARSEF 7405 TaxID=392613 RepID=A0A167ZSP3_9EURO|nr:Glycosyl hydrolase family 43, five-bladed beta-propellor domain protein [Ascosphaera apis ARSEF 7405]
MAATPIPLKDFRRPSSRQGAADAIPILVDDTYHLFFLTTPPDTIHHPERLRSSWTHLRSTDLVHWTRDADFALVPGDNKTDHDADGIWTGSAIIGPDGNMHIFYTGYNLSQDGKQVIIHAKSNDKHGAVFKKEKTPITFSAATKENLKTFEDIDFRDPYVLWNEDENKYWMLVGTRLAHGPSWNRGCLALATSTDLETWDLEKDPLYAPNDMHCPECPELFKMPNEKWYLAYSRFHAPDAGTVYRVADSPRGPFRKPAHTGNRHDARRWYAAKSCPKADDPAKRIYFGWIGDRNEGDRKWMWGGDMAFPREVTADAEGALRIGPCIEVLKEAFETDPAVHEPTNYLEAIGKINTEWLEQPSYVPEGQLITFRVDPSLATSSFGMLFRTDSDYAGYWLKFSPHSSIGRTVYYTLALSINPVPLDDFWADQYKLYLHREVDGSDLVRHDHVGIKDYDEIRILLLDETVEVFAGGRVLTYRFAKDGRKDNKTAPLGLFVDDGEVSFHDFKVFLGRQ